MILTWKKLVFLRRNILTEDVMSCLDSDVKHGEIIIRPATYCMICQSIVYATYILDHGVHHCPTCVSEKEINAITRAKSKREGRATPDARDLTKEYSNFRTIALSDDANKTSKVVNCNAIGCEHGTWNKDKTIWKWNEKWFCNLCDYSCEHGNEAVKKQHEGVHKEKWDKLLLKNKEGQEMPKVTWVFREDRRLD